jgi:3',5'-cyclic-AMP phosphodiesterase
LAAEQEVCAMLIAQVTDIHLGFDPDNPTEFNRKRLDTILAHFGSMSVRPDILLATGDLVDRGSIESYRRLKAAFTAVSMPVWPCLGNHDNRESFCSVFSDIPTAEGFVQYAVYQDGQRFLILDTLDEGRHGGGFCNVRAGWLKAQLEADATTPTMLVMHHPPVEVGIAWMNTDPDEPWVARFADAIDGHSNVVGMICGHLHRPIASVWRGKSIAICASSAPQVALDLAPIDPDVPDGRPMIIADAPAYALHRWNGRDLISHFDTVEDHLVLARYETRLQGLVRSVLSERPGGANAAA